MRLPGGNGALKSVPERFDWVSSPCRWQNPFDMASTPERKLLRTIPIIPKILPSSLRQKR